MNKIHQFRLLRKLGWRAKVGERVRAGSNSCKMPATLGNSGPTPDEFLTQHGNSDHFVATRRGGLVMESKLTSKLWTITVVVVSSMAVCFGSPAVAQQHQGEQTASAQTITSVLARYQARQNQIDAAVAPIKSEQDLREYLAKTHPGTSPLDVLSFAGKQRFLASLQFNGKGLTTFEYLDLENELTPTQIYRVLALFGVQRDTVLLTRAAKLTPTDRLIMGTDGGPPGVTINPPTPGDHEGYMCESRGTCFRSADRICTSNC